MVHVYPVNDTQQHELEGTCCWCEPHVDWNQPEAVVVHNSADGRELREKREEDDST
jgi:hypothetical protein